MTEISSAQPTRRERDLARHRAEAMDAAERLLERLPYTSITVQAIADEAEFSVGYLYKLFPSKDELYLALVETRKGEVLALIEKVQSEAESFSEGLRQMVEGMLTWLEEHAGFARDNRSEITVLFRRHHKCVDAIVKKDEQMGRPVVALFQMGIDEGVVSGAEPLVMANLLRALIWGTMANEFHREDQSHLLNADQIVQIILRTYSPHWKEHD